MAVELTLFAGEPAPGPWVVESVDHVVARLLSSVPDQVAIPVVAVDGRSGSGKSTAAQRIAATIPGAAVLRTDDVAWHHSYFDWTGLLRDGVLDPVRRGRPPVSYGPPAWSARSRPGAVEVPASCRMVIVEGVGAGRRELEHLVDGLAWVQSDGVESRCRGIQRDGGTPAAEAFWDDWAAQEVRFLADQRPWERAVVIIGGTPVIPHDTTRDMIVETSTQ